MKNIYVVLIIFSNLLFSCSSTEMNKLALALDSAGDNREELLKVLQYYKNDPDTLKYKAAVYLIQNMPYHCSTYNKDVGKIEKACHVGYHEVECTSVFYRFFCGTWQYADRSEEEM